uniref:Uncharacterized protein n=1 Tax=Knipowitschia caucasica TaxID=637954 RepID=A0AAV2LXY6_KNICA
MATYQVEVSTGDMAYAGTWDHISVTLVGTAGQSQKTELNGWGRDFGVGSIRTYSVTTPSSLGTLLLLRLDKEPVMLLPDNLWFCRSVRVSTPEGTNHLFPCYRWISRGELVGVIEHYYPSDADVQRDSELQEWISDIFTYAFLGEKASGCPQSFSSVKDLVKFVTMIIFNSSAQHSAVNNCQFDYQFWVPNVSMLLVSAPPSTKGQSTMQTVLDALPNVGSTATNAQMCWTLSYQYSDLVPLGCFPNQRFDEPVVMQLMKDFEAELANLEEEIIERNKTLPLPYPYLLPSQIEKSIAL